MSEYVGITIIVILGVAALVILGYILYRKSIEDSQISPHHSHHISHKPRVSHKPQIPQNPSPTNPPNPQNPSSNKQKEVYLVRVENLNPYNHASEGSNIATVFNAQQAEFSQLIDAFKQGAEWCYPGIVADQDKIGGFYPMQKPTQACGLCSCHPEQCHGGTAKPGIASAGPCIVSTGSGGVLLYGVKPQDGVTKFVDGHKWIVVPFNSTKWSASS